MYQLDGVYWSITCYEQLRNLGNTHFVSSSRIHNLEEQIRDIEIQSESKKGEEEARFKDSMARIEREKTQELELCVNRICLLQKDLVEAQEEIKRQQHTIDQLNNSKSELENKVQDKDFEIEMLNREFDKLKSDLKKQEEENHAKSCLVEALNQELVLGRRQSDSSQIFEANNQEEILSKTIEMENQLKILKHENRSLKEQNEELTAQVLNNHLMEGKNLLKQGEAISSLASEINDLNVEQVSTRHHLDKCTNFCPKQLKTTLKEQQDVNAKLRSYIDNMLLNIVDNYPQLLEVKSCSGP